MVGIKVFIYSRNSLMRPPTVLIQKWSLTEVVAIVKGSGGVRNFDYTELRIDICDERPAQ